MNRKQALLAPLLFLAACRPEATQPAAAPGAAAPAAVAVAPLPALRARPLTDVRFERTAERVERGSYLANAVIGCVACHSERDEALPGSPPRPGREFAGAIVEEKPGYRLVAPNLTPDAETGAGSWSDDMLARAIREGVGHDGRGIGGAMWWWAFRDLSDEDLAAIVVYLRSLPPVRNPWPPRMLSEKQEKQRAEAARPLTVPVPAHELGDPVERGRYLIAVADCMGCHTGWYATNPGAFAGGNPVDRHGTKSWSANITPDPLALGGWTKEMFRSRIRTGRGGTLHATMPWIAYRGMTDGDLDAIFAALHEVEPVTHLINNADEPSACPLCGQTHPAGDLNRPPAFERVALDPSTLPGLVGAYRNERYDVTTKVRLEGGKLFASEGGPDVELVACADGWFRGHGLLGPIRFERDASGKANALVGRDLALTRYERVGDPP